MLRSDMERRDGPNERQYLILLEGDGRQGYSSYAPDLPGVAAAGATEAECVGRMREAIELHFEGLREHGEEIPGATRLTTAFVDVDV